ncbi:MAG: flagellar biosynthesis protein FlhA [Legionellaceae bacterium]|nr:flagellar biosynthesis protein FlhA [Legionellaceae bacterium]
MDAILQTLRHWLTQGLGTPVMMSIMLGMMILPLPTFLLDILFTFNIAFALIVLLAVIYADRPLDFAVFPTVILLATLLRLALNVASTRVVLLNGHSGTDAAGQVIKSFGEVVIGGNYSVGLVVFIILTVINFVVVTKGAGRVSEVSARFTLDSLPGKQMAIDADLNAGLINQEQALARREEVAQEADFYGSMDGASKFVRGDAVAGIFILLISIIGGLIMGVAQHNMSFADAGHNYILLTIGDGLVAQVPALVLSTAAAIMVTRVSGTQNMGSAVLHQVFAKPRSLIITAVILAVIGLIPGMPHVAFLLLALGLAGMAWLMLLHKKAEGVSETGRDSELKTQQPKMAELSWDDVNPVDIIGLEVGYRLIPLVDSSQGGNLLARIKGVRKKMSQELGFLVPTVHIRDNLDLTPNHYRILLAGVTMAEGPIHADKWLAINPGQVFGTLEGIKTSDPAFGLEAIWIHETQKEQAHTLGFTVVDAATVVATHLSHILEKNAQQLLGYEETQQLLDKLAKTSPKLVKELVPDALSLGTVNKVMQGLLLEQIPLTDTRTIVETLAEAAVKSKEADYLISQVRIALSRMIAQKISKMDEEMPILTLKPELEQILLNSVQSSAGQGGGSFEPGMADRVQQSLLQYAKSQQEKQELAILVVQPGIRNLLARFARNIADNLHVLSYQEIPDNKQIRIIGTVG